MRRIHRNLLVCTLAGVVSPAFSQDFQNEYSLRIASLPLISALKEFSRQTGLQVGYLPEDRADEFTSAAPLSGQYTAESALSELLAPSGLSFERINSRTIAVTSSSPVSRQYSDKGKSVSSIRPHTQRLVNRQNTDKLSESPSVHTSAAERNERSGSDREGSGARHLAAAVEEIIVTGTHIRGVQKSASPYVVFDREDIDRTGAGSIQEFVRRLPQNFGDASETTVGSIAGGTRTANLVGGSGVDLRGVGSDSTLVLLNGRRLAPGNTSGNFVDISLIPLGAIERVEIVPDGASAIYGADAVGGVVNFILRKDFDDPETRLRLGTVEKGGRREWSVGQTLGRRWDTGAALLSYEYSDSKPLSADDRAYTRDAVQPFDLLPKQGRHGALMTLRQEFTDDFSVFVDGMYSNRSSVSYEGTLGSARRSPVDISLYAGTLGTRVALPRETQLELAASYTKSDTDLKNFSLAQPAPITDTETTSSVISADARLDGALWYSRAGVARYAIGAQFRDESFRDASLLSGSELRRRREVFAAFIELRAPILDRLELSLADRQEHYSDFGSSNSPQVGLIWSPSLEFGVRGTYGTSFKAPLMRDLDPVPTQVFAFPLFDPLTGGATNTLFVLGGNPDLQPEEAETWTIGMDLHPTSVPGLQAKVTYYDIRFSERIVAPLANVSILNALALEAVLGSQIIQRNPSQPLIHQLAATPGYIDFLGIDLATIGAIADFRAQNLSIVETSGIDLSVSYASALAIGQLQTAIDATYVLNYEDKFTDASPGVSILNTPYNPIDLRARASLALVRGAFTAALFLNYTDSYSDNRGAVSIPVDSWATADVTLGYENVADGFLGGLSVRVGVNNVTDEHPPLLQNLTSFPINFDGANASPLGRYYSLQVVKTF